MGREETVGGVLTCFVKCAGGAILEKLSNVLLHRDPKVGSMEQSIDFGMIQVKHATVGIANEQLAAGTGDDDGGALLGRSVYPKLLTLRTILNLYQTVIKVGVLFLGLNPSLQRAGQRTFDIFIGVGSNFRIVGQFETGQERARAQTSRKIFH